MSYFKVVEDSYTWNKILKKFKTIDSYYSYEYGKLFATIENGQLLGAFLEDHTTKVFYPFIKREIPGDYKGLYDIVTPYGYGGPLIEGDSKKIDPFYTFFSEYCETENIITETIRFHPLYKNDAYCKEILNVQYIRKTTSVDLSFPLEKIRQNYSSMNKKNIKKAKSNQLSCFMAQSSIENIEIFLDMYKETMDRNNAIGYYYFDRSYFLDQVKETCISKTYLLFTQFEGEIIAGVMVILGKEFAHYHLGASRTKYLDYRPNNLLFDYMIEFCKSLGAKQLHLGGGYQENDGLFAYKTSFTNNNNHDYYIGKKIYNLTKYQEVVGTIKENYEVNENFFPVYRGIINKKVLHS